MKSLRRFCLYAVLLAGCGSGAINVPGIGFFPNFFVSDGIISVAGVRAENPQICCSGSTVYAVWADSASGDVLFNTSTDGGMNWLAVPVVLNTVAGAAFEPVICCDGQRVYVAWLDGRSGARDDVHYNFSTDGGTTWLASDLRLDSKTTGFSGNVRICCDTPFVYVAWTDTRDGRSDVYANSSTNSGVSFQASDVRVDTGDAAGSRDSLNMELCCELFRVYVVWEDERNDAAELISDIYFNCSENGGAGWLPAAVRLNTDAAGTFDHEDPVICCSSQFVYVAWADRRNGQPDIIGNVSSDFGISWRVNDVRIERDGPGANGSDSPAICCRLASVWVAWSDDRLGSGFDDVFVNYSTDGGFSWQATDERINTGPTGTSDSVDPRICCDGSQLYVVWEDDRAGLTDILFSYSNDGGITWAAQAERLDAGNPGSAQSLDPELCCDRFSVYVLWLDDRNGQDEVFFNGSR